MKELTYQLSFNTPAFLGNAEQQAQWRTPPFKALLRQWWRVVKAPDLNYDHRQLLKQENELFGAAGGDTDAGRSRVQMRLSNWSAGKLNELPRMALHKHVERDDDVDTAVYLGYGPVMMHGKRVAVVRAALAPDSAPVTLRLRCPEIDAPAVHRAMQLAAWFGTLGSRARNAWGSLHVQGDGVLDWSQLCDSQLANVTPLRSLDAALGDRLAGQWPHAVGLCGDGRPAVWRVFAERRTAPDNKTQFIGFNDWKSVLEKLAALKIGFRTQFKLDGSRPPHGRVEDRHILAYPVTNHALAGLPNGRLASQMRFKVCRNREGQFFGLITHMPSAMPQSFFKGSQIRPPEIARQIEVWQQVHDFLNRQAPTQLARIRKG